MTYPLIVLPFAVAGAAVVLATLRRPGFARRLRTSALTALVLIALTVVFDNVMIAVGLFTYPEDLISGIRVGLAPIEDLSYPVVAAFALPAVVELLRRPAKAASPPAATPSEFPGDAP